MKRIAISRIGYNKFTIGNIRVLLGVILEKTDACKAGYGCLKATCVRRLRTTPFRNIEKVFREAMHKDITHSEANDFVEQVGKEIKYWLETI